jgi:putative ABC transport system permease protein
VENATRFRNFGNFLVRRDERKFQETGESFIFADSGFYEIFSFPLIEGDPSTVLASPRSLVLSERYVSKYFGTEDPIGKTLLLETDTNLYTVTGIMRNIPVNSHFHFDMVASLGTIDDSRNPTWLSHNYYTYVLMAPGSDMERFPDDLNEMVIRYVGPQLEQALGVGIEEFEEAGNTFGYFIQPIRDIHLHSNLQYEIEANGNPLYVYLFLIIAILILVIACINFMNLATARSTARAREVGLRKVVGSGRSLLVGQFLAESVMLSLFSLGIAVLLVHLSMPFYTNLIRLDLAFDLFSRASTIPLLLGLALIVGLIAGSYPAFVLASFQPEAVLKTELRAGTSRNFLRNMLVVLQFTVAIIILLGTFVVNRQLTYMQTKDLGFEKHNGLVIRRTNTLGDRIGAFKQELEQHSNILSVSNSTHIPGTEFWNNAHFLEGEDMTNAILLWTAYSSFEYDEALDLNIVEGRFFSRDMPTDSFAVLINQSAVRSINLEDPLNRRFMEPGNTPDEVRFLPIIGVIEDFHFASMHDEIHPMIIHFMPANFGEFTVLRLGDGNVQETVEFAQGVWEKFESVYPFDYTWLDDEFDRLFQSEERTGKILLAFSILSIFISCLGLFGMISYSTTQRTKEIGIRKALGASEKVIVLLLQKETLRLLGISALLAFPAFMGIRRWLQNFAYHIDFSIWMFLLYLMLVTMIALIIAMATVFYQTIRAAMANPAESLRVE